MCSLNFLQVEILDGISAGFCLESCLEHRKFPFANSQVFFKCVRNVEKLTNGPDVKSVYKLSLDSTVQKIDWKKENCLLLIVKCVRNVEKLPNGPDVKSVYKLSLDSPVQKIDWKKENCLLLIVKCVRNVEKLPNGPDVKFVYKLSLDSPVQKIDWKKENCLLLIVKCVRNVEKLPNGPDVKSVYKLSLDSTGISHSFSPGNTIAIIPCNNEDMVEKILVRLNLQLVANRQCNLKISKETTKKNPVIPGHLQFSNSSISLRNIFLYCIDIRTPPKKLFLKSLIKYTQDQDEATRLEQITSPKNSADYTNLISGTGRTLLGLLNTFPSCHPPVETILEHLPPLQPRAFSISSSPLLEESYLDITVSVVENADGTKGLCTGWLEQVATNKEMGCKIPYYFRQPNNFQLTSDNNIPIIMIATGTGIAPFRGFLQHRFLQIKNSNGKCGNEAWLFFGCRYPERDCLYKSELSEYLKSGALTRLNLCYSRESEEKRYVQHDIESFGEELTEMIVKKNAIVYVCGDFKTMMKEVKSAFVQNFVEFNGMSETEAQNYFVSLEKEGRYLTDCWL